MSAPAWQTRPATLAVAFMLVAGSMLMLEGFFDRGDRDKAKALVKSRYQYNGWSIGRYLAEVKHPEVHGATWDTDVRSGCASIVDVSYSVPRPPQDALVYRFTVAVKKRRIHPGNENGRLLMAEWDAWAKAHPPNAPNAPPVPSPTPAAPPTQDAGAD